MVVVIYFKGYPTAVGRPLVVKAAIAVFIGRPVGKLFHFLALGIHYHQFVPILDECELLAVGRILRHRALYLIGCNKRLLIDECGIGEVRVVFTRYLGRVDIVMTVAQRCVHYLAAFRMPHRILLGGSRIGNLFHRRMFHRAHKNFATCCKCHLLAVIRQSATASADFHTLQFGYLLYVHIYGHLLRFTTITERIYLAVVAESKRPICRLREVSHRVGLEFRHLLSLRHIADQSFPHIERATIALRQEIHRSAVC